MRSTPATSVRCRRACMSCRAGGPSVKVTSTTSSASTRTEVADASHVGAPRAHLAEVAAGCGAHQERPHAGGAALSVHGRCGHDPIPHGLVAEEDHGGALPE